MLIASSILLLVSPVVFLVILARKYKEMSREAERPFVFVAYALPAAALVLYALIWRLDATRVLLELRAVAFRSLSGAEVQKPVSEREAGRGRIVLGDVPKNEEAGRSRLLGTLVFRPGGNGQLTVKLPPPEARAGVIATKDHGIAGAEELQDGDRVCVDSSCWTYDADGVSFTGNGTSVAIPRRQTKIPGFDRFLTLRWAPPLTARSRTYSLEWLASSGTRSSAVENRVRSFLGYFAPRGMQLVLLDDNVTLIRGGKAVSIADSIAVKDGQQLSFFSLPTATDTFDAPGMTERRSVVYRAGERSFVLTLDTPEIRSLKVDELRLLGLGNDEEREKQLSVGLSMGNAQMLDRSLYLSGISESVALQASSLFELSRWFPRNIGSTYRVVSPRGPADATLGDIVWIGATDLAAIRFDVVRPPLLLLSLGLLLALLKYFAAMRGALTLHQVLFAGLLEALVGIRLLIGYRVWAMPPHVPEALDLGLVAWMTVPWLFLGASIAFRAQQRMFGGGSAVGAPWTPTAAGLLLSLVFSCRILEGRLQLVWIGMHVLAVAVALARMRDVQERWKMLRERAADKLERVRMPARVAKAVQPLRDAQLGGVLLASFVICLVRLLLLFIGYKEALLAGGRISLSAFHIPAAVIVEGLFFFRVWRHAQRRGLSWLHLGVAFGVMLFLWVIPGFATSDLGLALLNVPVFALLLVLLHKQTTPRAVGLRRAVISAPVAALCIVIVLAPLVRFGLPFVASEESMLGLASDANYARFLHFAAPERLRDLATKRGESLAITSALLQSYVDSGLLGRGYGATEVTPLLGDTALRDFAPAVFVAAEWGLVGTVALLLVYALMGALGMRAAPWTDGRGLAAGMIECVAAATIAFSSIYMILANHELVLLTGKNVYLLGLDSAGDLVEFVFLMFLIAYGAAVRRDSPSRRAGAFGADL
jgi:hypothetical protein